MCAFSDRTADRLPRARWVANRALDLGAIDAVGFDLDHTLALYDDDAVNALAMSEAQELLVARRGYRQSDVAVAPHPGDADAARALVIDLAHAHVVKLDAHRRVRVARRAGIWLANDEIDRVHSHRVPEHDGAVHALSSPFDVPTLWLFEAVTRGHTSGNANLAAGFDPARACRDAREMLDWSHTRGELKRHLVRDLARFVSPVEGAAARLAEWQRAGKRLFVVTNSELAYATAVLDLVIGPQWRTLFAVVSTSSAKPRFFDRSSSARELSRGTPASARASATVLEGARADAIETLVGARGERVLYVGDNARADIGAARAYGWRTVHVVAELAGDAVGGERWGSPFTAGDDPSWFARLVDETADAVCDRVDRFLARDPDQRIEAAGETA
jgi:5'-nucleotidase